MLFSTLKHTNLGTLVVLAGVGEKEGCCQLFTLPGALSPWDPVKCRM